MKEERRYISPYPDDPARDALDALPEDEAAIFYAAFEDAEEAAPRQTDWLRAGFVALLLLCAGVVLWSRALPLLPPEQEVDAPQAESEQPAASAAAQPAIAALVPEAPRTDVPGTDMPGTDVPGTDMPGTDVSGTDVPGTDVSPDAILLPAVPAASAAGLPAGASSDGDATDVGARTYTRTALLVDGKKRGVLVSREAAEALLVEIRAYYTAEILLKYDTRGTLECTIDNEITYEDAPDTPEEELMSSEEMFTLLTERKPLSVLCTETVTVTEPIPYKTETQKDKYLLKGTRIVVTPGQDGQVQTLRTVLYKNGRQRSESEENVQTQEPVDRVVRLGDGKITDSDRAGKREGKRGPETELTFQSPLGEDAEASIVSNYGQRKGVLHLGLDYEAEAEQPPVLAACAGEVVCVMERGGYGLMVEIDHGGGFLTRYAHLQPGTATVRAGDTVAQGQPIGTLGQSGNAEKPLLHFELRIDGEAYNPRYYLD